MICHLNFWLSRFCPLNCPGHPQRGSPLPASSSSGGPRLPRHLLPQGLLAGGPPQPHVPLAFSFHPAWLALPVILPMSSDPTSPTWFSLLAPSTHTQPCLSPQSLCHSDTMAPTSYGHPPTAQPAHVWSAHFRPAVSPALYPHVLCLRDDPLPLLHRENGRPRVASPKPRSPHAPHALLHSHHKALPLPPACLPASCCWLGMPPHLPLSRDSCHQDPTRRLPP